MKRVRDWRIDSWRGFLITLVVVGHVVGMAIHFSNEVSRHILEYIYKVIYAFHMPAFFFLAGLTWDRNDAETFLNFFYRKCKRLLIPYFVFGIISGMVFLFMNGYFFESMSNASSTYYKKPEGVGINNLILSLIHAGGWPENGVFRANSVLWFLPAIFSAEIIYWIIDRIVSKRSIQMVLIVLLYCLGFFIPRGLPWGMSRALNLLVFLALARFCSHYFLSIRTLKVKYIMIGVLVYFCFCFFSPNHWIVHNSFIWYFLFDGFALVAICITFFVVGKICNGLVLRSIGICSIGIMLIHKFVIVAFQTKLPIIKDFCRNGVLLSIVMIIIVSCITLIFSLMATQMINKYAPILLGNNRKN